MSFTCIYCNSALHRSQGSKSHIFAASLGGSISLQSAVCKRCNRTIATEIEDPFKDRWSWLLLLLGIKGRRGKGPPLRASINLVGREIELNVRSLKSTPNIPPIIDKDAKGNHVIHFIGSTNYVEKKKLEYQNKHPGTAWQEHDISHIKASEVKFPIDVDSLDSPFSRRLAAKIAFEFWGLKRGPGVLLEPGYDPLRQFILRGNESNRGPLAGLLCDETLISRNVNIQIPNHAVCLNLHPSTSMLGAIVVFFGMFYYWVILDPHYPLTASISEQTVISPRTKLSVEALLAGSTRLPRIPWERVLSADPDRLQKAWKLAREKFQRAS